MARKENSYAIKKRAGLCGYSYNRESREFQAGAWRNWPRHLSDADRARYAHNESAYRFNPPRGHIFTEKRVTGWSPDRDSRFI